MPINGSNRLLLVSLTVSELKIVVYNQPLLCNVTVYCAVLRKCYT